MEEFMKSGAQLITNTQENSNHLRGFHEKQKASGGAAILKL